MNALQIQKLIKYLSLSNTEEPTLIETHISWVILTEKYAYKIKKPLQYSFLDFSTLQKRKFYCKRELELNRRLTVDVYLQVIPIKARKDQIFIGEEKGVIIDYAVLMKRLDNSRQMNLLLEADKVYPHHMEQIAEKLSTFHAFTDAIETPLNIHLSWLKFADILKVKDFIEEELSTAMAKKIEKAVSFSQKFLTRHKIRIQERHRMGFTIDAHGDLHSKNIFLLEEPVIFDCIEFNDHFRQIDVLNELAFFCLDLDFYGREDLETHFLQKYLIKYPCIFNETDRLLFQYYKLYRANVRLKVNTLKAMQEDNEIEKKRRLGLAEDYFSLMKRYLSALSSSKNRVSLVK